MSEISKIQVEGITYDIKDVTARNTFINSKTDNIIDNSTSTDYIPTTKAVYDYIKKTTTIDSSSTDVPTAQAVYNYIRDNISSNNSNNEEVLLNKGFNPVDYYAINTIHFNPSAAAEEDIYDGLYKISDYIRTDGAYQITCWDNNLSTNYINVSNVGNMMGENAIIYAGIDFYTMTRIYIFPQEQTFISEETDTETGEITTIETIMPAGFYVETASSTPITISHLVKKENYIQQKKYSTSLNETLMDVYRKVSNETSFEGLYTILATSIKPIEDNTLIYFNYDCGGTFKPIKENYPNFDHENFKDVYSLEGNALIAAEGGPAAILFTTETTIPANTINNTEDIIVNPGIYLLQTGGNISCFELIKLQEKEIILDIDTLFGNISDSGTVMETVLAQLNSSETGNTTLIATSEQLLEGVSLTELYNNLIGIFEHKGTAKIRMGGQAGIISVDMLIPTTTWKINESNAICLGMTNTIMNNNIWIESNLQIISTPSNLELYCRAAVLN